MRNIFDQYKSPENRLTHALACSLSEDRWLLQRFVRWAIGRRAKPAGRLQVVEQQVPGLPGPDSDDDEGDSLPDMWIHDGNDWSLIVESKVADRVRKRQLDLHLAMAKKNGFTNATRLVIAPDLPGHRMPDVVYKTWAEVYSWVCRQEAKSEWAGRFTDYMQVAEERMTADNYLGDKVLTKFHGIPFDSDHPWSYREAKRVLRLMMAELRKRKELRKVGIDPSAKGKSAITGRVRSSVWDLLRLKATPKDGNFTSFPHLTIAIQDTRLVVVVILPHSCVARYRRNLTGLSLDGFCDLANKVERGVTRVVRPVGGAFPMLVAEQRHYRSQSSKPVSDARLELDLRTARPGTQSGVKHQEQWLEAVHDVLSNKKSNVQIAIGAALPFGSSRLKSPKVLDLIVKVCAACSPWIRRLMNGK